MGGKCKKCGTLIDDVAVICANCAEKEKGLNFTQPLDEALWKLWRSHVHHIEKDDYGTAEWGRWRNHCIICDIFAGLFKGPHHGHPAECSCLTCLNCNCEKCEERKAKHKMENEKAILEYDLRQIRSKMSNEDALLKKRKEQEASILKRIKTLEEDMKNATKKKGN